jgi:hypothetical protein
MKTNILLIALMSISTILFGQVPQGIPYQAVARDAQGNPMSNQSLTVQFSLHEASADGQVVYQETQTTTTNGQGLFSLTFGAGVPSVGTFANINWGSGYKFLQVQANFGNGYVDLGTQQLMSVPYALYSGSSGNGTNGQNSNYTPSADSVLTMSGVVVLSQGSYTVPQNENWKIVSIHKSLSYGSFITNAPFLSSCNYNSNGPYCLYTTPRFTALTVGNIEYSVRASGTSITNAQVQVSQSWLKVVNCPGDCPETLSGGFTFNFDINTINLPIWAISNTNVSVGPEVSICIEIYK